MFKAERAVRVCPCWSAPRVRIGEAFGERAGEDAAFEERIVGEDVICEERESLGEDDTCEERESVGEEGDGPSQNLVHGFSRSFSVIDFLSTMRISFRTV